MADRNEIEDVKMLKTENVRLKKTLKELTVEKNMMELKLYRAFNKLLSTKKRKIKRLERALKRLNGDEGALSDEDNHCRTCRCRNRQGIMRQRVLEEVEENNDSDVTVDPGSDYGSETEIDEDPPSGSKNVDLSSSVHKSSSVIAKTNKSSTEETTKEEKSANDDRNIVKTADKTGAQDQGVESSNDKAPSNSNSQSDYDMDDLVDEFCS